MATSIIPKHLYPPYSIDTFSFNIFYLEKDSVSFEDKKKHIELHFNSFISMTRKQIELYVNNSTFKTVLIEVFKNKLEKSPTEKENISCFLDFLKVDKKEDFLFLKNYASQYFIVSNFQFNFQ